MEKNQLLPKIPKIGLGTWKMDDEKAYQVVLKAIKLGYRYIDCAWEYENEVGVGKAIKEALDQKIVKREDLFIVTKLWNTYHRPDLVEANINDSLKKLNLTYVDFDQCAMLINKKYGLKKLDEVIVFKIEYKANGFIIPITKEGKKETILKFKEQI